MSRYHLLEFVFWELHKSAGLLACLSALQWPACVLLWGPPEASPGASVCQGRTEMKSCQGFGQGPQGDQLFTGNQRVHPAQGGVSRLFFNNVCPAPRMSCTVRWRRYNRTRERQSLSFEWPWSGSQIKGQGLNALPRLICTLLRWLGKRDMSCVLWTEMFILIISTKWQKFIFTSIQAVSWAETACILGLDHQQTPTDFLLPCEATTELICPGGHVMPGCHSSFSTHRSTSQADCHCVWVLCPLNIQGAHWMQHGVFPVLQR